MRKQMSFEDIIRKDVECRPYGLMSVLRNRIRDAKRMGDVREWAIVYGMVHGAMMAETHGFRWDSVTEKYLETVRGYCYRRAFPLR